MKIERLDVACENLDGGWLICLDMVMTNEDYKMKIEERRTECGLVSVIVGGCENWGVACLCLWRGRLLGLLG
jgi:hypothetical protein